MAFGVAAGEPAATPANAPAEAPVPKDLAELRAELEKILKESGTPGMSLAIATRDEVLFAGGLGLAQVEPPVPADADTMFRIGSTSKAFVAIAALKLVREGKLDLNAPLAELAPEIWFHNPWEATDPVRFVHLLEHTTGWDDIHLRDYANEDPSPNNIRDALDFDPDSRVSRWKPGTRMAYCNAGPVVAAYVIQKITGASIEDFVGHEIFPVIGMPRTNYFLTDDVKRTQATLYHPDGVTPYPYWHISMRAAGSINSSAREMAEYVRFHLNRGRVGPAGAQEQFVPEADMLRMETPVTNLGAQAGLTVGYGLHNYSSFDDAGFLWRGHNGGVLGGASDFSYLAEHGIGYAFQVNALPERGFREITKLVRRYLTQHLPQPKDALPPAAPVDAAALDLYPGFYLPASPRVVLLAPLERTFGVALLTRDGDALRGGGLFDRLFGEDGERYVGVPGAPRLLRRDDRPVPEIALLEPSALGAPAVVMERDTWVRAPAPVALAPLVVFLAAFLLAAAQGLFMLAWLTRALLGRLALRPYLEVRLWPVASCAALGALLVSVMAFAMVDDLFTAFGAVTVFSLALAGSSVLMAVVPWLGLWRVMRAEQLDAPRGLRRFALLTLGAHAALGAGLVWFGMVPFVTWR